MPVTEPARNSARADFLFKLGQTCRWSRSRCEQRFKTHGLTYSTWSTLVYLKRAGEGVTQRQLADFMQIETPSLVRLLDSLEQQNLIVRRPCNEDRRRNKIHFTSNSQALIREIDQIGEEIRADLLSTVSDEELASCLRTFNKLMASGK